MSSRAVILELKSTLEEYEVRQDELVESVANLLDIRKSRLSFANEPVLRDDGRLGLEILIARSSGSEKSADAAAAQFVSYSPGRLSFELLFTVMKVERPTWEDGFDGSEHEWADYLPALLYSLLAAAVALLGACMYARRKRRRTQSRLLGATYRSGGIVAGTDADQAADIMDFRRLACSVSDTSMSQSIASSEAGSANSDQPLHTHPAATYL
eukprot:4079621-Pleurochrysis_carterae.AAC.1